MSFTQKNLGSTYSKIISPQDYNTLMTDQHLYIKKADAYMAKIISDKAGANAEVVEIGCGPARITPLIFNKNKAINLYGLDVDTGFLDYAKETCRGLPIQFVNQNILQYVHQKPVDIFYSQGFHHHFPKLSVNQYLDVLFSQLKKGGIYVLGDEFIAEYETSAEREINLILWYAHIIANARAGKYDFLAQEEAKTLLDDIYEGRLQPEVKTPAQIKLALEFAEVIDTLLRKGDKEQAQVSAKAFLEALKKLHNVTFSNTPELDLSRRDFKISPSVFKKEVEKSGFLVETERVFGPPSNIGGMMVFVLYKS